MTDPLQNILKKVAILSGSLSPHQASQLFVTWLFNAADPNVLS